MKRWIAAAACSMLAALVSCVSDAPDTTCPDYCKAVTAECMGADSQYVNDSSGDPMPACQAICAQFPLARDAGNNSIACRKTAASSASELRSDPKMHHAVCQDAGPFSDMCGGVVANFCHLELALCPGSPYANEAACMTAFPMIAKDGSDVSNVNDPAVTTQNSKVCRFYHVEKATENPMLHCPHTNAPVSPICTM